MRDKKLFNFNPYLKYFFLTNFGNIRMLNTSRGNYRNLWSGQMQKFHRSNVERNLNFFNTKYANKHKLWVQSATIFGCSSWEKGTIWAVDSLSVTSHFRSIYVTKFSSSQDTSMNVRFSNQIKTRSSKNLHQRIRYTGQDFSLVSDTQVELNEPTDRVPFPFLFLTR